MFYVDSLSRAVVKSRAPSKLTPPNVAYQEGSSHLLGRRIA